MALRVITTYVFDVIGDGVTKEALLPLRGFRTPEPLEVGLIPTGFHDVQVGASPGGATFTLEGEFLHITFDVPPPADVKTKVTLTALFGTTRI
jgi:hypothetical protein